MLRARRLHPEYHPIRQEAIQELEEEAIAQDERDEDEIPTPEEVEPEFAAPDTIFEAPPAPEVEREVLLPVNPLYERQHSLGLHTPSVALIGAGGVGCWVALSLILGGVTELTIFDGDSISVHNLNRFPLPEAFIGELKSLALAKWLRTLRPKADIQARGEFSPDIHSTQVEWVVCATDSLASRRLCHKYATEGIGAKYLEVGADGERWGLSPSPPEFSTELEGQAGYQTVPVHVGPCMMAGAAAAYYVLHDTTPSGSHAMEWNQGVLVGSWMNEAAGLETDLDNIGAEAYENDEQTVEHVYSERAIAQAAAVYALGHGVTQAEAVQIIREEQEAHNGQA